MLSFESRRCTCVRHQDVDHMHKCDVNVRGTPELRATIGLVPLQVSPRDTYECVCSSQ